MKWLISFTVVAWLVQHQRVHACPPVQDQASLYDVLMLTESTVGPLPLLIAFAPPHLTAEDGHDVELVQDPAFTEMAHSWMLGLTPTVWRPRAPLPEGKYLWAWHRETGPRTLFVDSELLPENPPTFTEATFEVVVDRDDDDGGGCSDAQCRTGNRTRIEVSFMSATGSQLMLVDVSGPASNERTALFKRTEDEGFTHKLEVLSTGYFRGLSFDKDVVCVGLTPVAEDGTVGERIDLGCSNPKTGANFTNLDEGCASAETSNAWFLLGALALIARRRLGYGAPRGRA